MDSEQGTHLLSAPWHARLTAAVRLEYESEAAVQKYKHVGVWHSETVLFGQHCPAGGRILEVACGGGRSLIDLARRGGQVSAIDASSHLLSVAAANLLVRGLRADLHCCDMRALPFPDATFDFVYIGSCSLELVPGRAQRLKALAEFARVTRFGGVVLLTAHSRVALTSAWVRWLVHYVGGARAHGLEPGDCLDRPDTATGVRSGGYMHITNPFWLIRHLARLKLRLLHVASRGDLERDACRRLVPTLLLRGDTLFWVTRKV